MSEDVFELDQLGKQGVKDPGRLQFVSNLGKNQTGPILTIPLVNQQNNQKSQKSQKPDEEEQQNSQKKPKKSRRKWSPEEDERLIEAVAQQSPVLWDVVSTHVPGRTAIQCKERYCYRLKPNIKKGPFELWEDIVVIMERERVGNRWTLIANKLKGRTVFAVKNRWYTYLKNIPKEMVGIQ